MITNWNRHVAMTFSISNICLWIETKTACSGITILPGPTASTRAPMALPSFQSVVKFLMGSSGTLFCTHRSSLCLGVGPSLAPEYKSFPRFTWLSNSLICRSNQQTVIMIDRHRKQHTLIWYTEHGTWYMVHGTRNLPSFSFPIHISLFVGIS